MNRRLRGMLRSLACSSPKSIWDECAIRPVPETVMTRSDVTPYPARAHLFQPSYHGRASVLWAHLALCRRHVTTLALSARVETI